MDLKNKSLHVKGAYQIPSDIMVIKIKLKTEVAKDQFLLMLMLLKFLNEWLEYLDENYKDNIYLLPGKNGGPLSYKYITCSMWKTYAAMGLADITVRRDGHVVINSSPLKGFPTKMFRHRLATHLIAAMNNMESWSKQS